MQFDGSQINLFIAYIGGFFTFFASCLLPMVPTYIAYMSGIAVGSREAKEKRGVIFTNSLMFAFGFILVFTLFGVSASIFGNVFKDYQPLIEKLGGILFITMGLFLLKVIKPELLYKEKRFHGIPKTKLKYLNSLLFGISFAFGWSPCIGPVLAVIIFMATQAQTEFQGTLLLFTYGLGLATPFIIVGLLFDRISSTLNRFNRLSSNINIIAGILLVISGILMFTGQLERFSVYVVNLLNITPSAI